MADEASLRADPSQTPPRKRRRTVLSCLECRSRKLKCDRQQPCARCVQGGHPETCAYATSSDEVALNPRHTRPRKSAASAAETTSQPQQRQQQQQQQQQQEHHYDSLERIESAQRREQHLQPQPQPQSLSQSQSQPHDRTLPTPSSGPNGIVAALSPGTSEREWMSRNPRPYHHATNYAPNSDSHITLEETLLARVSGQLDQLQRRVNELEAANGTAIGKGGLSPDVPRQRVTYHDERDVATTMTSMAGRYAPSSTAAASPALSHDTAGARLSSSGVGGTAWPSRDRPSYGQLHSPATTVESAPPAAPPAPPLQKQLSLPLPPICTMSPGSTGALPLMMGHGGRGNSFGKDWRERSNEEKVTAAGVDRGCPRESRSKQGQAGSERKDRHCSKKQQFYGPSAPSNMWRDFPGLWCFIKGAFRLKPELRRVRMGNKFAKNAVKCKRDSMSPPTMGELLSLLPSEEATLILAKVYIREVESVYRIVHVPSFWRDYDMLTAFLSTSTPTMRSSPPVSEDFVVTLLLAIATVFCMPSEKQLGIPLGIPHRYAKVVRIIAACDDWLKSRSYKRTGLPEIQIRCLLFLARRTNELKMKQNWTYAGELLRLAMTFGLHRDESVVNLFSVFEGEMRRRLWATIMEFEIQACLDRGFSSALQIGQWDCQPPANIHDEDFDQDCETLPAVKPLEEFTRCSYLCVSGDTVALRLELLGSINNIHANRNYDVTLENDEKVIRASRGVPNWPDDYSLPNSAEPNRGLARAFARLQLEQFLIYIHHPFASQTEEKLEHRLSRMHSIKSCFTILDHCNIRSNSMAIHMLRNDAFRAGLSLCYNLVPLRDGMQNPIQAELIASHVNVLEKSLNLVEQRTLHISHDLQKFYALAAANAHVHKTVFPNSEGKYELEFARRLEGVYHKQTPDNYLFLTETHLHHHSDTNGEGNKFTGETDTAGPAQLVLSAANGTSPGQPAGTASTPASGIGEGSSVSNALVATPATTLSTIIAAYPNGNNNNSNTSEGSHHYQGSSNDNFTGSGAFGMSSFPSSDGVAPSTAFPDGTTSLPSNNNGGSGNGGVGAIGGNQQQFVNMEIDQLFDPGDISTWGLEDLFSF